MANGGDWKLFPASVNPEPSRHVIVLKFVTATGAELVGGADCTEAVAAACGELVVALRAEVKVTLHVGAACGTSGDKWRAQEEVKDSADSAWHDKTDEHPEARTHGAAGSILADVADHEDIEGCEESPGDVEVCAKTEGDRVMLRFRENDPEVVLHEHEDGSSYDDGPYWYQPGVFVRVDQFWFAHT